MPSALNARLAGFYFAYYGTVGAFMAYWAPYLVARGFSPQDVGIAYALMGLVRATVPLVWGWWADRSGKRMALVRGASILSLLLFAAIPLMNGVGAIMTLMIAYTLFWNALLPQFETVVLTHLGPGGTGGDYARVRVWGSVGFIIAVLSVGWVLDRIGILWEPGIVALLFAGMAMSAWAVPDPPQMPVPTWESRPEVSIWSLLRKREVQVFLFACFCSQLSFAPYYSFFTVFLDHHGYTRSVAGQLWSLGVLAEIGIFLIMGRLLRQVPARTLLLVALACAAVRWLATGLAVESMTVLIFAQASHAISFAAYHSVAMHYVQTLFPPSLQGRGQALYNSAAYGLGGSIGSLASGYLWQHVSPEFTFVAAALMAAIGAAAVWRWLRV